MLRVFLQFLVNNKFKSLINISYPGAPKILQTDNGREFENTTLKTLIEQWPGCKFIHGKPRHSQSQGSVERCNQDIENILFCVMRDRQTIEWAKLLDEVQFMKNTRYHSGIKRTPFKAMFGKFFCLKLLKNFV